MINEQKSQMETLDAKEIKKASLTKVKNPLSATTLIPSE
jgi:hypothetical protein